MHKWEKTIQVRLIQLKKKTPETGNCIAAAGTRCRSCSNSVVDSTYLDRRTSVGSKDGNRIVLLLLLLLLRLGFCTTALPFV
jgi:hypothetical protein